MKNLKLVFGYELKNHLGKKTVQASTLVIMLLIIGLFSIPRITKLFEESKRSSAVSTSEKQDSLASSSDQKGYVFASPELKDTYAKLLNLPDASIYPNRAALIRALTDKKIKVGFDLSSETAFETIYLDKGMRDNDEADLSKLMKENHINTLLLQKNITLAEVEAIQRFEPQSTLTILGKSSSNNMMMAMVLLFVVYMIVLLYGSSTSTMIAREKDSKTMEILITSCKPRYLILGKVAASAVAAILQSALIFAAAYIGFQMNREFLPPVLSYMLTGTMTQSYVIIYLLFSIFGFIMYLFLYAALGSTVSKVEDVASATGFVQFLFIGGYMAASFSMNMPDSPLAVITSIFPFTSLMVMPLRAALVTVPLVEIILSFVLLLLCTVFLAFMSIKIYRWGTLNYGNKKSSLRTIMIALKHKD